MRVVKSPRSLNNIRQAGKIMDQVMAKAIDMTKAGVYEGDIWAELYGIVLRSGATHRRPIGPLVLARRRCWCATPPAGARLEKTTR